MPSPFPGMDPFLEAPEVFPELHHDLITFLKAALKAVLPPPYYASSATRVWIEAGGRVVEPDVDVLRRGRPGGGEVTVLPHSARPVLVRVPEEERREAFINVFAREGGRERLVTSVEVLSPSNKAPGAHGRGLYQRKQEEAQRAGIGLVEIDLLRGGRHTTAVPEAHACAQAGPFEYHVCVLPGGELNDFQVYPIRLADRLPPVAVPLDAGAGYVTVDLQEAFDRAYEIGSYPQRVDYAGMVPPPALAPDLAAWVELTLQTRRASGNWGRH